MIRKITVLTILLGGMTLCAQESSPFQDFKKGTNLMERGKYQDAAAIFQGLAEKNSGAIKTKALLYKALADGKNSKIKLDDALKSAEAVPDEKLKSYAQMNAYFYRNRWAAIVEKFADEKIETWPEEYAYLGWYFRGDSLAWRKQYDKARADLELAKKNVGADGFTYMKIWNSIYRMACEQKDYQTALEAIGKIQKQKTFRGSYLYLGPIADSAQVYIGLKKYDEGHKVLDELKQTVPLENGIGPYSCLYFISRGKLYLAQGNKEKARQALEKAVQCKNTSKYYINRAQKLLNQLQAGEK